MLLLAATVQVYFTPGVSPFTWIGEVAATRELLTPPLVDLHTAR
jgi:hypothetical protein